ncbi:hypothetical protein JL720_17195 [Aureococcus anophagefferens]|nr:hypothetical protein JL720_17195 [Aureococcus anophagefferens]
MKGMRLRPASAPFASSPANQAEDKLPRTVGWLMPIDPASPSSRPRTAPSAQTPSRLPFGGSPSGGASAPLDRTLARWIKSYNSEQTVFASDFLSAEVKLREAATTTETLRLGGEYVPPRNLAIVTCDVLLSIAKQFGRFEGLMNLARASCAASSRRARTRAAALRPRVHERDEGVAMREAVQKKTKLVAQLLDSNVHFRLKVSFRVEHAFARRAQARLPAPASLLAPRYFALWTRFAAECVRAREVEQYRLDIVDLLDAEQEKREELNEAYDALLETNRELEAQREVLGQELTLEKEKVEKAAKSSRKKHVDKVVGRARVPWSRRRGEGGGRIAALATPFAADFDYKDNPAFNWAKKNKLRNTRERAAARRTHQIKDRAELDVDQCLELASDALVEKVRQDAEDRVLHQPFQHLRPYFMDYLLRRYGVRALATKFRRAVEKCVEQTPPDELHPRLRVFALLYGLKLKEEEAGEAFAASTADLRGSAASPPRGSSPAKADGAGEAKKPKPKKRKNKDAAAAGDRRCRCGRRALIHADEYSPRGVFSYAEFEELVQDHCKLADVDRQDATFLFKRATSSATSGHGRAPPRDERTEEAFSTTSATRQRRAALEEMRRVGDNRSAEATEDYFDEKDDGERALEAMRFELDEDVDENESLGDSVEVAARMCEANLADVEIASRAFADTLWMARLRLGADLAPEKDGDADSFASTVSRANRPSPPRPSRAGRLGKPVCRRRSGRRVASRQTKAAFARRASRGAMSADARSDAPTTARARLRRGEEHARHLRPRYLKWGFAEPPPGMAAAPPAETARRQRRSRRRSAGLLRVDGPLPPRDADAPHVRYRSRGRGPAELPLVSVVVPTYPKRHAYHALTLASFRAQRYPNLEMVVLDTGARGRRPSTRRTCSPTRVRYVHTADDALTLGEKRTELVKLAKGDVVAHFDDDNLCAFATPVRAPPRVVGTARATSKSSSRTSGTAAATWCP